MTYYYLSEICWPNNLNLILELILINIQEQAHFENDTHTVL